MKTILVPTDLSETAENAAQYALQLASSIKANVKLCSAFRVPEETVIDDEVFWPMESYTLVKKNITGELEILANSLARKFVPAPGAHQPQITYTCQMGSVTDMVTSITDEEDISMIVMGLSGAGAVDRFFLGSASRDVIDNANCPVLLIPPNLPFKKLEKVAFATDLNEGDIEVIHSLACLTRYFDALILIAHVTDEKYTSEEHQHNIDNFFNEVSCKANYPKVDYRNIKNMDVEHGLHWLTDNGKVDMLAMVHHWHHFFSRLFTVSYTKKMAKHINLPLLVYPGHDHPSALPVF